MNVPSVKVDIAPGELIDKITILTIKSEKIEDFEKLEHIQMELDTLTAARDEVISQSEFLDELSLRLKEVNECLWVVEDEIRNCEAIKDFGNRFIELARSVYRQNDERARIKREINGFLGSIILEEKSYKSY